MAAVVRKLVSAAIYGRNLKNCCTVAARWNSSTSKASNSDANEKLKWNLYGSVCLERKPVISSPMKLIERDFAELLSKIEVETSLLNDHELRHVEDMQRQERMKSGEISELDLEASAIQTAHDFEDLATEEYNQFKPASRTTKADQTNDLHILNRRLDHHLLLITKSKLTSDWMLPMCLHQPQETLRQTAERAIMTSCGTNLQAQILGNAPIGFFKFKFNGKIRNTQATNNAVGGKIFFFRAHYTSGQVDLNGSESISDYGWLTREDMCKLFSNKEKYLKCLQSFLIDEEFTYHPSPQFASKYSRVQAQ